MLLAKFMLFVQSLHTFRYVSYSRHLSVQYCCFVSSSLKYFDEHVGGLDINHYSQLSTKQPPLVQEKSLHMGVIVKKSSPKNLSAICWPTVGRLSAVCRPFVGQQTANRFSPKHRLSVGRQSADSW